MREAIEEAFWNFVDQKWRDTLNVAAAEPPSWGTGSGGRTAPQEGGKKGGAAGHEAGQGSRARDGDQWEEAPSGRW